MKESRAERFRRVAEARVNKIIKMIRLLGNCSGKGAYQYDTGQVEQIFTALQTELDAARKRFAFGMRRFSLSGPYNLEREMLANPHISLEMPNKQVLTAVAFNQGDYLSVNMYLSEDQGPPELICFAEYIAERSPDREVYIGVYQSDEEDTAYYAPYWAERDQNE